MTSSSIEKLRQMLILNGITETFTDAELQAFIDQAIELVDLQILKPREEQDYITDFEGDVYVTSFYPIIPEEPFELKINNRSVTPEKIRYDNGIIYLKTEYAGKVTCKYTVGISEEEIQTGLLPICLQLVKDARGHSVASVTEGDVTVHYKTGGMGDITSLDALIQQFRTRYDAIIRWL